MKLHSVFITYNRLELTKRAISSYLSTVTVPCVVTVVDNNSSDGTQDYLHQTYGDVIRLVFLPENRYPGFAFNRGCEGLDEHTTHLHRADNDFVFKPNWCDEVERMFSMPHRRPLGQLGMRTDEEEEYNSYNVGGNCVISRELWEKGLRYDETPWPEIKSPGWSEDSFMSPAVLRMGYRWDRVETPCIASISTEDPGDSYYIQSWADRKIDRNA